jgi:restriction endonuclease S subunit
MQSQVLNYSTAKQDDGTFRLDAEHYQEKYLRNQKQLLDFGAVPLHSMISRPVMTGHTPSKKIDSYYGDDVAFVKTDNLREFKITGGFSHRLSQKGNEIIKRSELKKSDLIITIIGATYKIVGRSALVRAEDLPANINQNIALIRLKKGYSPEFLSAYLNSDIGKLAIWYLSRQTEQVNLNCREIEKILVPKVSPEFASIIGNKYEDAVLFEHESRAAFLLAENLLLAEIGLNKWHAKHQIAFVKNYSDTEQAERIDAEYFQPKYEAIIEAVKAYKGGWDTLGDLVTVKKSVEVGSGEYLDEGIPFIRVSNLSPFEITEEKYVSEKLYAEIKQHQPKQGEILFSKDGTPGIAHYLDVEPRKMIPSGGVLRLKSKTNKTNNEYLTLVLNSILVKEQINRDVGGSIILHWRPDQVKETVIPILAEKKQTEIQTKVIESLSLRKQSKHLLECAKRAVEIAIEKDEPAAIDWLKDQVEV